MRNSRSKLFSGLMVSCLVCGAAVEPPAAELEPVPWTVAWHPSEQPVALQVALKPLMGPVLHLPAQGGGPGATVVVWGEGPQEAIKRFQARLDPELEEAFFKGLTCTLAAQDLGETIGMGWDVHAPSESAVYYNCLRPDPSQAQGARFKSGTSGWH